VHELSDVLTRRFGTIVIEDLVVKNMVKNGKLACSISDAGFGMLRRMVEYKSALRGCNIIAAPRFYPSSKTCSQCGCVKDELLLDKRTFHCDHCGFKIDRDVNAALNLLHYGMNLLRLDAFRPDAKRTQESRKTIGSPIAAVSMACTSLIENIRF
jgi:putative transposase